MHWRLQEVHRLQRHAVLRLISDFCALGSLYDFLQSGVLEKRQPRSIMLSAISGLNHLHDGVIFYNVLDSSYVAHNCKNTGQR